MQDKKHIHLIGICGTAMASLAGLLQLKGHHVTGLKQTDFSVFEDGVLQKISGFSVENAGVAGMALHANAVAQDGSAGEWARWIDRDNTNGLLFGAILRGESVH